MTFIEFIDQNLFYLINTVWSNAFFDLILPPMRERFIWAPLYVYIIAFFATNFKENWWKIILFLFACFAIADYTSSSLLKPLVARVRPCNDMVECGSGYSFTSSHATNHFAIAVFLIHYLRNIFPPIIILAILWASAISYAQVYVGVHYPLDILCGAILGSAIGWFVAKYSKRFTQWEF
jgi:membrane-associated phospholipid phosphatase